MMSRKLVVCTLLLLLLLLLVVETNASQLVLTVHLMVLVVV